MSRYFLNNTYRTISAYHHLDCELESHSWRGVLDTTLSDKAFSDLRQVGCFLRVLRFPPPIKTDHHDYN